MENKVHSISIIKILMVLTFLEPFLSWGINFPGKPMLQIFVSVLYLCLACVYITRQKRLFYNVLKKNNFRWINYFLVWVVISCVMGLFMARNYYEYKHLVQNAAGLLAPLLVYVFLSQKNYYKIWHFWYKFALPVGLLLFPVIYLSLFYYAPVLLLIIFFPIFSKKKQFLIVLFAIACIALSFIDDAREHILKCVVALALGLLLYFRRLLSRRIIKIIHVCCYLFVFFIFLVAMPGFRQTVSGHNTDIEHTDDKVGGGVDTRSLLYLDVITSAIEHDYYIFGRSPARGNDIIYSATLFMIGDDDGFVDTTEFVKGERTANEMSFPNVFTWTGLTGLFLYMMIYFKASYLAVYKSRNKYMMILGCFIAFRWSIGWVVDCNWFDITNVSLWATMAMCYSPQVRNMTDLEFKHYFRKLIHYKV